LWDSQRLPHQLGREASSGVFLPCLKPINQSINQSIVGKENFSFFLFFVFFIERAKTFDALNQGSLLSTNVSTSTHVNIDIKVIASVAGVLADQSS
jgi:CRISPR/Cas system endoribonuclease Cas6 (RAMP superfamily)